MSSQSHQGLSILTALPVLASSTSYIQDGCLSSSHQNCIMANKKGEVTKSMLLLPFEVISLDFYMTPSLTSQRPELNHMSTSNSKRGGKCSLYSRWPFAQLKIWVTKEKRKDIRGKKISWSHLETIGKLFIL